MVVPNVTNGALLTRMHQVIARLIARAKDKTGRDNNYDLEATHTPEESRLHRIKKPHLVHLTVARLAARKRFAMD